jgi:hypothetical protein
MSKARRKEPDFELEYTEYLNQLSPQEKRYIKQFYNEYYDGGVYTRRQKDRIIKKPSHVKEAGRNNNASTRDAFAVAKKLGLLVTDDREASVDVQDGDWAEEYKIGGVEAATNVILDETIEDLDNMNLEVRTTLVRFFIKMYRLLKVVNREARK